MRQSSHQFYPFGAIVKCQQSPASQSARFARFRCMPQRIAKHRIINCNRRLGRTIPINSYVAAMGRACACRHWHVARRYRQTDTLGGTLWRASAFSCLRRSGHRFCSGIDGLKCTAVSRPSVPVVREVVARQKELPVRFRLWFAGCFTVACVIASSNCAFAAQSADRLLPASTKGFISAPDVGRLNNQFNHSQFGQLVNDPAMKPFLDGFRQQLHQQGLKQLDQLGLSWEELEGLPKGEVALAVIEISPDEAAVALIADVTGHADKAAAVLAKVGDRLSRNGGKRIPRAGGDATIIYQLVGEPGAKPPVVGYCIYRDTLVACDNIALSRLSAASPERRTTRFARNGARLPQHHGSMRRSGRRPAPRSALVHRAFRIRRNRAREHGRCATSGAVPIC